MEKENIYKEIEALIIGFLTNSLNENDLHRLNNWLEEDVANLEKFNQIRSAWILAGYNDGKKKFHHRSFNKIRPLLEKRNIKKRFLVSLGYAASLIICFVIGSVVAMLWFNHSGDNQVNYTNQMVASTVIYVPLGSQSNITLPDGTKVWLNAGSTINYQSDFGINDREIFLTGEAFFDVIGDSLKPFKVHTSGITVNALGTRFNVKAYPEDEDIAATLEKGLIDVLIKSPYSDKIKSVRLKPQEQLIVQKVQPAPVVIPIQDTVTDEPAIPEIKDIHIYENVKTELSTSWKDNKWIIDDLPLSAFTNDLERRYNLVITFESEELKNYKFTGIIEEETAEQIFNAMTIAAPIQYTLNKNHVVLSINKKNKDKFQIQDGY